MAHYFLDSSALVKRHATEVGSAWVRSWVVPAAGHVIYAACITAVEVASALVRRTPPLPPPALTLVLADVLHDFTHQYRVVPVDPALVTQAVDLAARHRLRGYDAVQLAAALVVRSRLMSRGHTGPWFVSADVSLNAAAVAEGFAVDDSNSHP